MAKKPGPPKGTVNNPKGTNQYSAAGRGEAAKNLVRIAKNAVEDRNATPVDGNYAAVRASRNAAIATDIKTLIGIKSRIKVIKSKKK